MSTASVLATSFAVSLSISAHAQVPCGGFGWLPGEGIHGLPGVGGTVHASVVFDDGAGPALYVGGSFSIAGDEFAKHVAKWDGQRWSDAGSGLKGDVRALVVHNGKLFAGGLNTMSPTCGVAMLEGSHWTPVGWGFSNSVESLASYDGQLIAGGFFTVIAQSPVNGLARWDGAKWETAFGGAYDGVYALMALEGSLVAAGGFTTIGGVVANRIARWTGATWEPLGAGLNHQVRALAIHNDELIVGGWFSSAGGVSAGRVARWDGRAWHAFGSGLPSTVESLLSHDGELFAGGSFSIGSGASAIKHIARWDGAQWSQVGAGMDQSVNALTAFHGEVIASGEFATADGLGAPGVARWNGGQWNRLGAGFAGAAGIGGGGVRVHALTEFDGELIAGGMFSGVGPISANHMARWDGRQWHGLGGGVPLTYGLTGAFVSSVNSMTVHDGRLVVGGEFPGNIRQWDGTRWSELGTGTSSAVLALTEFNGDLVAGGLFSTAGSVPVSKVARWDGRAWHSLNGGMSSSGGTFVVNALTIYRGELIAAGRFKAAGGVPAKSIARWNGRSWAPLGAGMGQVGSSSDLPGEVTALAVYQGDLIAIGPFTKAGDIVAHHAARWDGTQWYAMSEGMTDFDVYYSLALVNGELMATGQPDSSNGSCIRRWDGVSWQEFTPSPAALGGSTGAVNVYAILPFGGSLYVGGSQFQVAGDVISVGLARYACAHAPADLDGDGAIGSLDLAIFLAHWGPCPSSESCLSDLNGDGVVNGVDLAYLLGTWTD